MKNLDFIGYPLYSVTKDGRVFSSISKRFLKNSISSTTGRPRVALRNDQHIKTIEVQRLVALAFVDNPNGFPIVNHLDGDILNNHYKNLEWTTYEGNSVHAVATGLFKPRSLTVETVHNILSMMEDGMTNKDIHETTGINYPVVAKIRQGENYRDLWEQYTIPSKSHTISLNKARKIKTLLSEGKNTSEIIKEVKVRRCLVKDIRDGIKFKNLI